MRLRDLEIRLLEEHPLKSLSLGNSPKEISPPPTGINSGNYNLVESYYPGPIEITISSITDLFTQEFYLFQNHLKLTTHKIR